MTVFKRLLFILVAFGLAACEQATIVAPLNNFVSDEKATSFEILFSSGIPEDLEIQLNTAIVTNSFTVVDTGASGNAAELSDHIFPGRNVLRVTAYNKVRQNTFYFDVDGPAIRILDTDYDTKIVSGYVSDPAGVVSVLLDGNPVTLGTGNTFTTTFVDQSIHTFEAVDNYGHSSTTGFARNDNEFTGISARLNQGGFDFLISALEGELNAFDWSAILANIGEIDLINTFGLFDLSLTVTDFSYDNLDIDLVIQDDERIDTSIVTDGFVFGIELNGKIGFFLPYSGGGTISFDQVSLGTDLLLDIVDSDLDVSLSETFVDHTFPAIDFANTNGIFNIIDTLTSTIVGVLAPLFENLFINILEQIIVPIVSDFIQDIPINLQLITLDDGETLNIRALPQFLDSKENGVSVDLATRIWAPTPPEGIPGALGSLYVDGETPTMGATTPSGAPFDFGASISSNVINQALLAAHESGVTTMEISPGFYDLATPTAIAVYNTGENGIATTDQIGMRIEPSSPPYVTFSEADGVAGTFGWNDVSLTFDLYKEEWGEYRTLFGVTFNLEVFYEVNATEDGFLSISIEQLPVIVVTKTDIAGLIVLPGTFITSTLDYFMPVVMPRLAEELKIVPLPRIYNHTLFMEEFWAAGSAHNNLSLAGSLVPISVTEAATAPTTTIESVDTQDVTVLFETVSDTGTVSSDAVTVIGGEVTIDIDGLNPNPELGLLEHRYRLDGGGWSNWKMRDTIELSRLLAGTHEVEVCSRTVLMKKELSCPVVTFETAVAQPEPVVAL